uniref:Uncharacterized protein n=1 Tax=Leersia perrieri TaxID=77586 RepID=A0A0D9V3J4_9ORYZ
MTKLLAISCMVVFSVTFVLVSAYITRPRNPTPFLVLARADGIDPGASSAAPSFRLEMGVVGLTPQYTACVGGDGSTLQVSYHGMAIAWAVCHGSASTASGLAASGPMAWPLWWPARRRRLCARSCVYSLIWSERQIVGSAEFSVEGEIKGPGYLRCRALLFRDDKYESDTSVSS